MKTQRRKFLYSLGKLSGLLFVSTLVKAEASKANTNQRTDDFSQSHSHSLIAEDVSAFASIKDFGALGDGSSHLLSKKYKTLRDARRVYPFIDSLNRELDWAAFQMAVNSGKDVLIPEGRYMISKPVEIKNRSIKIYGQGETSILVGDSTILKVTNCYDSIIGYLRLENATRPFLIDRWKDGMGYQPTVNDPEYELLSSKQQNQDITPQINIFATQRTKVIGITGNFASIIFWNSQYCSVSNCDIRAGKSFAGGIVFWADSSDSQFKNIGNEVLDNVVRYASFSGIVFAGAESCVCSGNRVEKVGESCYKTWQGEMNGISLRCHKLTFDKNVAIQAYYDNFDLGSDYPHQGTYVADSIASNNISLKAGGMGFYVDGKKFRLEGNTVQDSGLSGMHLDVSDSTISSNQFANNNQLNEASGYHELTLTGLGRSNLVEKNGFKRAKFYNGSAIYSDSPNSIFVDNRACNVSFDFNVAPAKKTNNLEVIA